ncbi:MAG: hypothetical protein ACO24Y_07160 [Hylemonella sp.]
MYSEPHDDIIRNKYLPYASQYLAETHNFDLGLLDQVTLNTLIEEVLASMKHTGAYGEMNFTDLLAKKLMVMGYF